MIHIDKHGDIINLKVIMFIKKNKNNIKLKTNNINYEISLDDKKELNIEFTEIINKLSTFRKLFIDNDGDVFVLDKINVIQKPKITEEKIIIKIICEDIETISFKFCDYIDDKDVLFNKINLIYNELIKIMNSDKPCIYQPFNLINLSKNKIEQNIDNSI